MRKILFLFQLLLLTIQTLGQECGKSKSAQALVIGGTAVNSGDFPWVVPLFFKTGDMYFCGSNLISDQYLLTAAHCLQEKKAVLTLTKDDIYAYVGRFDLTKNVYEEKSSKQDIKKITIHPDWSPNIERYDADLALLRLKNKIQFSEVIQPVCLPNADSQIQDTRGLVVGYGRSEANTLHENIPRKVDIKTFTNEECFFADYQFARFGSPRTFCAGEKGKTPCQGDSGSGFLVKVGSSMVLSGLVSAATIQECGANDYVIFTNVPKFVDWIQNEMRNTNDNDAFDSAFDAFDEEPTDVNSNNLIDVDCRYQQTSGIYACFVNNLQAPDTDIQLRIRGGNHAKMRTNRDVQAMQLIRGSVSHFPDLNKVMETFPNLSGFGITFTKMKHIDRSKLSNLGQLKFLLISDNEIEEIPADTFLDLKNLELIDICRNKIAKLEPSWIASMPKLRVFKARSNKFTHVPANMFKNNPQLEEILFDYNQLARIEVNFNELQNLKTLRILDNACINMEFCKDPSNQKCVKSLQQFSLLVTGYCGNFTP